MPSTFQPKRDDVLLKIQWAYQHIERLHKVLDSFIESNPYGISIERDANTRQPLYRITKVTAIPDSVPLIAGDILHNLRSALDYLACELVVANGNKPTSQTGFPILENAPSTPDEEKTFARKVKGMGQGAINLIRSIKPYKGGDDTLWRLHRLNIIDKHKLLFTVGAFVSNWSITQHIDATDPPLEVLERMGRAYASDEHWAEVRRLTFPLKAGDILLADFPDAKFNKQIRFAIQIAINEPGVCEGEPLVLILRATLTRIRRVVGMFAALRR